MLRLFYCDEDWLFVAYLEGRGQAMLLRKLRALLRKLLLRGPSDAAEPPRDPYAGVRAPIKPRKPTLSSAVALAEPEEE